MKQLTPILALFFFMLGHAKAQAIWGSDEIDDARVSEWNATNISDYQGHYSLGFSEGEYSLLILVSKGRCIAQLRDYAFNEDATAWVPHFKTLSEVRIEGNRFFSKEFVGQFAIYDEGSQKIKGIKRLENGDLHKNYEFGSWQARLDHYFSGKYIQASTGFLEEGDLSTLSKSELKVMRNEIFARYGYIFIKGGEMDSYFSKQDWYQGHHRDVNDWLTEIELSNIDLIRKLEGKK